jgi:hypothetical protein
MKEKEKQNKKNHATSLQKKEAAKERKITKKG